MGMLRITIIIKETKRIIKNIYREIKYIELIKERKRVVS
jgi:hypothetical protein